MTAPSAVTPYRACCFLEDQHKVGDNFYGSREVVLPMDQVFVGDGETQQFNQSSGGGSLYDYAYQSLAGRFNYDFGGKYLAEFVFRYATHRRASRRVTCAGSSSPRYPLDGAFRRKTSGKSLRSTSSRI